MGIPDEMKNYIDAESDKLSKDIKDVMQTLDNLKRMKENSNYNWKFKILFTFLLGSLIYKIKM